MKIYNNWYKEDVVGYVICSFAGSSRDRQSFQETILLLEEFNRKYHPPEGITFEEHRGYLYSVKE